MSDIDPERLVAVYAAPDAVSAQMIRGLLEAEGIAAVIGEQVTEAYAPFLQIAAGLWGEVCVRAGDVEKAHALITMHITGQSDISDAELEAAAASSFDPDV